MNYDILGHKRAEVLDFAARILARGIGVRIRAHGWSMYPFVKHGDFIEVEPVEASAVRIGDVVLCRDEGQRFIAHRVVEVSGKGPRGTLVTKGDWTSRTDPLICQEQVLGRVVAIERGGTRIRLDTVRQRLLQVLWARISPHSRWLYLPVRRCVRAAHRVMDRICSSMS